MTCTYRLCSCNRTTPLNPVSAARLGRHLGSDPLPLVTQLCGRDADSLLDGLNGNDTVVVGCTQERELFEELASEQETTAPIRFVNLRESAGWGRQAWHAVPKMAALLAEAALPPSEPVAGVQYVSRGRTLIVGNADVALPWAEQLRESLSVTVLLRPGSGDAALPVARRYNVFSGSDVALSGWLGAFQASWRQANPVDLDVCVRCNACIVACPEQAIDLLYQVNEDACRRHGECVRACGAVGAIDFARDADSSSRSEEFDLVLDLSDVPLFAMHAPPQGYFAPGATTHAQMRAALKLVQMVGEFEKPRYFRYRESLCAHARNRKTGCNACVEICSTEAIRGEGDGVRVEPHLCMGCGACTTVCPTGALRYAYPDSAWLGKRLHTLLSTYLSAEGEVPELLFHSEEEGATVIAELGRAAAAGRCAGLPANVIPVALHHMASAGLEIWLGALCYGARRIHVLASDNEAPDYVAALRKQMKIGACIMNGLGYDGDHFSLIEAGTGPALDVALRALPAQSPVVPAEPARFHIASEKRNALDFALQHLFEHAPLPVESIPLPAGAPFGALAIDTDACTLCMACTGVCPSSALMNTPDMPRLRFAEKNCVQCGLCAETCPEDAISLVPRLAFGEQVRQPMVLNESQPFHCIRCAKPIGTVKAIESLALKLAGHGSFAGHAERLQMCGDCRVTDIMGSEGSLQAVALRRPR